MLSDFIQERTVYRFVLGMDLMHLLDFNGMPLIHTIPLTPSSILLKTSYWICICLVATLGKLVLTEPLNAINVFQEVRWLICLVVISNPDLTLFYAEMPGHGRSGFKISLVDDDTKLSFMYSCNEGGALLNHLNNRTGLKVRSRKRVSTS